MEQENILIINRFGDYIYEISIDGKLLKPKDKVLLKSELELVTVDKLMNDHLYVKFSDGWIGKRKYSEINLV